MNNSPPAQPLEVTIAQLQRELAEQTRALAERDLAQTPTLQAITEAQALLDNVEREKLRQALIQTHNNRLHAAKLLGISRSTLYEKLKRYHLLHDPSTVDPQLSPCTRNLS